MSTTVSGRLEQDRRDLLDLGMRNPLLNFRELKGRGARVDDELSAEVYRILVAEGRQMSFLPAPEGVAEREFGIGEEENLFAQPDEDEDGPASRHTDQKLQTPYSDAALQRRLLSTYYLSRTYLEERGINVLFLTLGVLRWYESADSRDPRLAPLVLIPVQLERRSATSRFKLTYTGGPTGDNMSLKVKLATDFGIELPELPDDDELDISSYLKQVSKAVRDMDRWRVDADEIHLSFLSFTKLLMYEDLDSANWPEDRKPHEHELLRAVLGEGFGRDKPLPNDGESLDQFEPESIFQVVDADSSQTEAIRRVLEGWNMVIQGPPGTGKSQTITNLIAEAVAAGKKVLFVAEKMAALEVVKRRLDNAGIGDCCIEIHSHNTNKREFLAELERTLKLGKPSSGDRGPVARMVRQSRDHLNEYAQAVNEPIGRTGVTPYSGFGRLLLAGDALEGIDRPLVAGSMLQFDDWTPDDVQLVESRLRSLESLLRQMGLPREHPFAGSRAETFVPTLEKPEIESASREAAERLELCEAGLQRLAATLGLATPTSLGEADQLVACAHRLADAPPLSGAAIRSDRWTAEAPRVRAGILAGEKIQATYRSHAESLLPHAWETEVLPIRNALAAYGQKWWRFLSGPYRQARRELAALWSGPPPRVYEEQIKALDAILLVNRLKVDLDRLSDLLTELYGRTVDSDEKDWHGLKRIFEFLDQTHREIAARSLPSYTIDVLEQHGNRDRLVPALTVATDALRAFRDSLDKALAAAKIASHGGGDASFPAHRRVLEQWQREPGRLQEMASFNHAKQELIERGLEPFVSVATDWSNAPKGLLHLFRSEYYGSLLARVQRERPILARFDGSRHGSILDDFRKSDKELLVRNRVAVARSHWDDLPAREGVGQVGTLLHEVSKKRRHRPIRVLIREAGRAIQAIKPVFMMSPLSIASFIPPGSLEFDLVVFDEASQVKPVDAYGALLRGKQAVVVGDSRQLPPTSFFEAAFGGEEDSEEEYEERASDIESILGLFEARGAHPTMLKWHYRSKHESLIALSNQEFYEGKLTVFPSPDTHRHSLGLVYHHLPDTHYERGRGRSYNRGEAKHVARAVMEHARERPDLTLGVAAFSQAQMDVIQDELEILRRTDPTCEGFFAAHPEEPFFVKNLENVQGDERDVIFISVGYGRTAEGFVGMNFGPVNREGGERRLNVLITRARRRCEVFTNLRAEDIDLQRAGGRGVAALKRYLRYAELDLLDLPTSTSEETDSDFEEVVASALRAHGHEIDHQVGSAGFFIDLAVKDPKARGRYILGIECDGAGYHSARWARDRDRLRQEVLESLGWKIHRIWSTDWFYNRDRELRRTLAVIEQARQESDRREASGGARESGVSPGFEIPREEARADAGEESRQHSLPPYQLAEPVVNLFGRELHDQDSERIASWVEEVVKVESPVHLTEVVSRVAKAAGSSRAGRRIREAVERGIKTGVKARTIRLDSDQFLWDPAMKTPIPRDRSDLPVSSRKLELVSDAEIGAAVIQQAKASHGAYQGELINSTGRLLGFGRVSGAMFDQIERVVEGLVRAGDLTAERGLLVARES